MRRTLRASQIGLRRHGGAGRGELPKSPRFPWSRAYPSDALLHTRKAFSCRGHSTAAWAEGNFQQRLTLPRAYRSAQRTETLSKKITDRSPPVRSPPGATLEQGTEPGAAAGQQEALRLCATPGPAWHGPARSARSGTWCPLRLGGGSSQTAPRFVPASEERAARRVRACSFSRYAASPAWAARRPGGCCSRGAVPWEAGQHRPEVTRRGGTAGGALGLVNPSQPRRRRLFFWEAPEQT